VPQRIGPKKPLRVPRLRLLLRLVRQPALLQGDGLG